MLCTGGTSCASARDPWCRSLMARYTSDEDIPCASKQRAELNFFWMVAARVRVPGRSPFSQPKSC